MSAFAGIAQPNPSSVGLHEATGFVKEGVFANVGFKHDGWRDVGRWQLALTGPPRAPAEPSPWSPPAEHRP
jgi:phosphinothricin acetyltransferase